MNPIDFGDDTRFSVIHLPTTAISFLIPDDWDVWEPPHDLLFLASDSRETDPFEAQVTVSMEHLEPEANAKDYLVCCFVGLKHHLNAFAEQESGAFMANGIEVAWLKYKSESDGCGVTQRDYYVVTDQTGYVFNCKAPSEHFGKWEACFATIGRSISLASDSKTSGARKP